MDGLCKNKTSLKSNRCSQCRKKSHVLLKCSCEKTFCMMCRHADLHSCGIDYREQAKQKLIQENPVVVAEKVLKI